MKKSLAMITVLIAGLSISGNLASNSTNRFTKKKDCIETGKEPCNNKRTTPMPDALIWESFSREFL